MKKQKQRDSRSMPGDPSLFWSNAMRSAVEGGYKLPFWPHMLANWCSLPTGVPAPVGVAHCVAAYLYRSQRGDRTTGYHTPSKREIREWFETLPEDIQFISDKLLEEFEKFENLTPAQPIPPPQFPLVHPNDFRGGMTGLYIPSSPNPTEDKSEEE